MTIYNLFYLDNFVRSFSSKAKAAEFIIICCESDSSLDPTDYWISETALDDMKI